MINNKIADTFDGMADVLEIRGKGSDKFRIISYRRAALSIRDLSEDLEKMSEENRLEEIPGVGKGIHEKIEEYLKTGKIAKYEEYKKLYPQSLIDLVNVPSLGPKGVKILHEKLGIKSVEDLKKAAEENKIAELEGFGEKKQQNILEGLERFSEVEDRVIIGKVFPVVQNLLSKLKECSAIERVEVAGSFRRGKETIGDIDILASGDNSEEIIDFFVSLKNVGKILGRGPTKASVIIADLDRQVDLRVVKNDEFGAALQYFTGSKQHNVHLRTIAKSRGYKVSEYGIFEGEKKIAGKNEEEIYEVLGMDTPAPELREDNGEIEAAQKQQLPNLINIKDLKGDLHMHTNWSDGGDTIQSMIEAALARGYEFLALTDHSPSSRIANGLDIKRLRQRNEEIRKIAEKFKIKVLLGSEVDILSDGSLDYPNEVLTDLDVVVASIHIGFKKDNTERLIKAIENPHVKIIGHPSGRLIGQRAPYEYDLEKVIESAKENRVALEINSSFPRMDLNDKQAKLAKEKGCLLSINTDSHTKDSLWMSELGIKIARRAWLEKDDVINTWKFEKLYSWLHDRR